MDYETETEDSVLTIGALEDTQKSGGALKIVLIVLVVLVVAAVVVFFIVKKKTTPAYAEGTDEPYDNDADEDAEE